MQNNTLDCTYFVENLNPNDPTGHNHVIFLTVFSLPACCHNLPTKMELNMEQLGTIQQMQTNVNDTLITCNQLNWDQTRPQIAKVQL